MSTTNIQDACNQRKFNLLNNIPLVRNEKKVLTKMADLQKHN